MRFINALVFFKYRIESYKFIDLFILNVGDQNPCF